MAVIKSVVRPDNKDQNLFHVLRANSLTTLLDVNGRIKEVIELQERQVRDVKKLVRKSDGIQVLLQLQMSPPFFSYMEGSRYVVNAKITRNEG